MRNIRKKVICELPILTEKRVTTRSNVLRPRNRHRGNLTKPVTLDCAITTITLETFVSVPDTQHSGLNHFGCPGKNKWLGRA